MQFSSFYFQSLWELLLYIAIDISSLFVITGKITLNGHNRYRFVVVSNTPATHKMYIFFQIFLVCLMQITLLFFMFSNHHISFNDYTRCTKIGNFNWNKIITDLCHYLNLHGLNISGVLVNFLRIIDLSQRIKNIL